MMIEISKCSQTIERELQPCVFEIEDAKPHCVLCGRQCSLGENNSHYGPVIEVSGWFEAQDYHEPATWSGMTLCTGGKQLFAGFTISIWGYTLTGGSAHRYSFCGQQHVGVDKVAQGRTQ